MDCLPHLAKFLILINFHTFIIVACYSVLDNVIRKLCINIPPIITDYRTEMSTVFPL